MRGTFGSVGSVRPRRHRMTRIGTALIAGGSVIGLLGVASVSTVLAWSSPPTLTALCAPNSSEYAWQVSSSLTGESDYNVDFSYNGTTWSTVASGGGFKSGSVPYTVTTVRTGVTALEVAWADDDTGGGGTAPSGTSGLVPANGDLCTPAAPTISTTLSATTIPVDTSAYDTAPLSGATPDASGTVTYRIYTGHNEDTCTGLATHQISGQPVAVTVTSGNVPDSAAVTFTQTGTYYWQATYSGDSNNNGVTSTCTSETVTVTALSPTISTTLSATTIPVDTSAYDTAPLSGATPDASGTVTYRIYTGHSEDTCTGLATTQISGQPVAVTVTSGNVPDSAAVTFTQTGTYYWQATYSGDSNNNGVTSTCTSETVTVTALSPTISTTLSATTIPVDTSAYDTAPLSGATPDASGTVTYRIYTGHSEDTCTGLATTQISGQPVAVTVTSGNVPDSAAVTFTQTGTYYWQATYSGDSNNNGVTSTCTSETVTVTALSPTISTTLSATTIPVDTSAYDTAPLSGATPDASGTVTYRIYTGHSEDTCTGLATTQISGQPVAVTVTSGNVPDSAAVTFTQTGTYYWQATYSG